MKRLFFVVFIFFCFCQTALAVLPPEYYRQKIQDSHVKAIARVVQIDRISHRNSVDEKKVVFQLIKNFGDSVPDLFIGICYSVNKRWWEKEPMVGGTIYQYPQKGDKVYVTASFDGGLITSYTVLYPELEDALFFHPQDIEIGISEVRVKTE